MNIDLMIIIYSWTLALFFWYCSSMLDWFGDMVVHHKRNVFNRIKNPFWHKYFNLDKDWWRRKYLPDGERKYWTVLGIKIIQHPAIHDAWHGFKLLRKFMNANMAFAFSFPIIYILFDSCQIVAIWAVFITLFGAIEQLNCATWYKRWLA